MDVSYKPSEDIFPTLRKMDVTCYNSKDYDRVGNLVFVVEDKLHMTQTCIWYLISTFIYHLPLTLTPSVIINLSFPLRFLLNH